MLTSDLFRQHFAFPHQPARHGIGVFVGCDLPSTCPGPMCPSNRPAQVHFCDSETTIDRICIRPDAV